MRRGFGRHLSRADLDLPALGFARMRGERAGVFERGLRAARYVQLDVRVTEADVRQREARIEPERLIERSRRVDPDVRMQVRQALVVHRLRVG